MLVHDECGFKYAILHILFHKMHATKDEKGKDLITHYICSNAVEREQYNWRKEISSRWFWGIIILI